MRKEYVIAFLFLLSGIELGRWTVVHAQTNAGSTIINNGMITGSLPSTAVPAPTTGGAILAATDGAFVDVNGTWVKLGTTVTSGVTQITVCPLGSATCTVAPLTGAVVLNIPTKINMGAASLQ
jgi:hypothetical protein